MFFDFGLNSIRSHKEGPVVGLDAFSSSNMRAGLKV